MLGRPLVFMGNARDHIGGAGHPRDSRFQLVFPADKASVRNALHAAQGAIGDLSLGAQIESVVEIVLAEVLNNVVEHAYADLERGVIELVVSRQDDSLFFSVEDDGRPFPNGELPAGLPHDLDVSPDILPEGGFGWLLIRELTENLAYNRSAGRNHLTFRIPFRLASHPN